LVADGAKSLLGWLKLVPMLSAATASGMDSASLSLWWARMGDDSIRHRALFKMWEAAAQLAEGDPGWGTLLRVPTDEGSWIPLEQAQSVAEQISPEEELGKQVLELLDTYLPKASVRPRAGLIEELRRHGGSADAAFRHHATQVGLADVCARALAHEARSASPRNGLVIALGQWATRRNRLDLVTHVVVETPTGRRPVPIQEALLAEPYHPDARARRGVYGSFPTIVPDYFLTDPWGRDAAAWSDMFKKSARGPLRLIDRVEQKSRWQAAHVASLVGLGTYEVPPCSGGNSYEVWDWELPFDPAPCLEHVAAYLEQEGSALQHKGRMLVKSRHYGPQQKFGTRPSAWARSLAALAWVPCTDQSRRKPSEVLSAPDPARKRAPVAQLPPWLLKLLSDEGFQFGSEVPEEVEPPAPPMSGQPPEAFAEFSARVREVAASADPPEEVRAALGQLDVPHPEQGSVKWARIARKVGTNARSALGGWVLPVDSFGNTVRALLAEEAIAKWIPETTTGHQALAYLRDVWARASRGEDRLASTVRDALANAYEIVLSDEMAGPELARAFDQAIPDARVFAGRDWIPVRGGERLCLNDLPFKVPVAAGDGLVFVAPAHLGASRDSQKRTAQRIGIAILSTTAQVEWEVGHEVPSVDACLRFSRAMSDLERLTEGDSDPTAVTLGWVESLSLRIGATRLPRRFRLDGARCTVTGRAVDFAPGLAEDIATEYLGTRSGVIGYLVGVLAALEDRPRFEQERTRFRLEFGLGPIPESELERKQSVEAGMPAPADEPGDSRDVSMLPGAGTRAAGSTSGTQTSNARLPAHGRALSGETRAAGQGEGLEGVVEAASGSAPRSGTQDEAARGQRSQGSSYTMARAISERIPRPFSEALPADRARECSPTGPTEPESDESFRQAVVAYEALQGRTARLEDAGHEGFDLTSTGKGETRLIEVKGRRASWEGDEVAIASPAQTTEAARHVRGALGTGWWLYVVEELPSRKFKVLPIRNPLRSGGLALRGDLWRPHAEEPGEVVLTASEPSEA
jgi:hypothetical protein